MPSNDSVSEEDLEQLRKDVESARESAQVNRAAQQEEIAARTREIKAARLRSELGGGVEAGGVDLDEEPDSPAVPEPAKPGNVTTPARTPVSPLPTDKPDVGEDDDNS